MKWPIVRMFGCSHCKRLATSQGSHWCGGEWRNNFDTIIRYVPEKETKREDAIK
jgi:hypothetical protein